MNKNHSQSHNHGSLTLLIGDPNTYKGRLGRSFLSRAFRFHDDGELNKAESGACVLLTTDLVDQEIVVSRLLRQIRHDQESKPGFNPSLVGDFLKQRTFVRRLSARHMASANLLETISTYIHCAKLECGLTENDSVCDSIRFVIDDWNVILASHANIAPDAYLLPAIVSILRREGITSLLVASEEGASVTEHHHGVVPNSIRQLEAPRLVTWVVPFFGEKRVAISTQISTKVSGLPTVFEIRPKRTNATSDNNVDVELLELDRHFNLYSDIELGKPKRIPLRVKLYSGNHPTNIDGGSMSFHSAARSLLSQNFVSPSEFGDDGVVTFEEFSRYDELFAIADGIESTRLDHTLVFQIDEFWSEQATSRPSLMKLSSYLDAVTARRKKNDDGTFDPWNEQHKIRDVDSFSYFQPHNDVEPTPRKECEYSLIANCVTPKITHRQSPECQELRRSDFFWDGCNVKSKKTDRIPYLWDFGFIVADRDLWQAHSSDSIPGSICVGDVWNSLDFSCTAEPLDSNSTERTAISWDQFFAACNRVRASSSIPAFDLDLSTAESLSCLVFEIWASTEKLLDRGKAIFRGSESFLNLGEIVSQYYDSLYYSLCLLTTYCPQLQAKNRKVDRRVGVEESQQIVAARHWYHTASAYLRANNGRNLRFLRLPGSFAIRGDWSLAVASGSRSEMLGHLSLDSLSSRRMNLLRLQDGIGLPYRDIVTDTYSGFIPTALSTRGTDGTLTRLSYNDVCLLGSTGDDDFQWAFRSSIRKYDRDSFYWRRWIARMIEEQSLFCPLSMRTEQQLSNIWDRVKTGELKNGRANDKISWCNFLERVDLLRSALRGIGKGLASD